MKANRTITIDTNFNGKMANEGFLHIDLAPAGRVPESRLNGTVIEIKTRDESHPPVQVKLVDISRLPFSKITDLPACITWCSHAMYGHDLAEQIRKKNQDVHAETEFAIYFYQKIKN